MTGDAPEGMEHASISRSPQSSEVLWDRCFRALTYIVTVGIILSITFIVLTIFWRALPAIQAHGSSVITGKVWDPNTGEYGIRSHIWGTVYSSLLALVIASLFGISAAIFLSEGFLSGFVYGILRKLGLQYKPFFRKLPERAEHALKTTIELLAAIPSVVYGLWGIFVVIPKLRKFFEWLHKEVPSLNFELVGPSILPASIVLAIMILPTITAISRDALILVPQKLREASYGMGATRWQALWSVILPTAAPGIMAGVILGFGRALGETMALAMLIGNKNDISWSVFSPGNTLAALLANNFPEANKQEVSILMYAALVLLVITILVNMIGNLILLRANARIGGK